MNIRDGFVSNSSSSSFIIVGKKVKWEELDGLKKRAEELKLGQTIDNGDYDHRAMFDCGEFCDCDEWTKEHEIIFGFGACIGEGYISTSIKLDMMEEWIKKARELFGDDKEVKLWGITDGTEG